MSSRLIRELEHDGRFAAVSHWTDMAALSSSEKSSAPLREQVADSIAGAAIERVSTSEIVLAELAT